MFTYKQLSTAAFATISLTILFADLGHAQTGQRFAGFGKVRVGWDSLDQGAARRGKHHLVRRGKQRGPTQANAFDGSWTVSLRGTTGLCSGHSLTYLVQIRNGHIVYRGGDGTVSGRVTSGGAAFARVVSGDRSGTVSGHLSRSSGGGSFQGQAGGGPCSGTWGARRG
jgi:hypothetical protein